MKKLIQSFIILAVAVAFFSSCEKDAGIEYDSIQYGDAPAFSDAIETSNVKDSTFTLTFTPTVKGYIYYMVQDSAMEDPSRADVINYGEDNGNKILVEDQNGEYTVTPADLEPTHVYEVFAVHTNEKGVGTLHEKVVVETTDTYAPVVMGFTPAPSLAGITSAFGGNPYAAGYPAEAPLAIHFNEPVFYNSDYSITITGFLSGLQYEVPADSIEDGSSKVLIHHETLPYNGDIIFVSVDSAAFGDGKGNAFSGFDSYLSAEGYVYGWFFGTAPNPGHVLSNIFSNFQGEYLSNSYDPADSTTLMYGDEVTLSQNEEGGYFVTVEGFNGYEGASATFQMKEDQSYKYLTCERQSINDVYYIEPLSDLYEAHGTWNPSDYSLSIDLAIREKQTGTLVEKVHQVYVKRTAKKSMQKNLQGIAYPLIYD